MRKTGAKKPIVNKKMLYPESSGDFQEGAQLEMTLDY